MRTNYGSGHLVGDGGGGGVCLDTPGGDPRQTPPR